MEDFRCKETHSLLEGDNVIEKNTIVKADIGENQVEVFHDYYSVLYTHKQFYAHYESVKKNKYLVNVKVVVDEIVEVTANSLEEAKEIAERDFYDNDIKDWLDTRSVTSEITDNLGDAAIFRKLDKEGLIDEEIDIYYMELGYPRNLINSVIYVSDDYWDSVQNLNVCWDGFEVETVNWLINQLPKDVSKVFDKKFKEEKSLPIIAKELGTTESEVTLLLDKGLNELALKKYRKIFQNGIKEKNQEAKKNKDRSDR